MDAKDAVSIFENAVEKLLVQPRYTGPLEIRMKMQCKNGYVAEASIGTDRKIMSVEAKKDS